LPPIRKTTVQKNPQNPNKPTNKQNPNQQITSVDKEVEKLELFGIIGGSAAVDNCVPFLNLN
jgi:hypothetical protein